MLCIETSTSLTFLYKFKGAAGEFKGAVAGWHPLISSPEVDMKPAGQPKQPGCSEDQKLFSVHVGAQLSLYIL